MHSINKIILVIQTITEVMTSKIQLCLIFIFYHLTVTRYITFMILSFKYVNEDYTVPRQAQAFDSCRPWALVCSSDPKHDRVWRLLGELKHQIDNVLLIMTLIAISMRIEVAKILNQNRYFYYCLKQMIVNVKIE